MTNMLLHSFIYENLVPVNRFNEKTELRIYEPTHKLYVVKRLDRRGISHYEKIAAIENPHLAKIFYIADLGDCAEVVREYISGDTLADLLRDGRTFPEERAVAVAADICRGLRDLHAIGYVHRDINPNNIVITTDGNVRIIDYEIVRSFSRPKSSDTEVLGTPGYAAPEQFGFSQSDARTDIYAVGVLLNVMLTGALPGVTMAGGKIGRVIAGCVEIDPAKRYENVAALLAALEKISVPGNSPADRALRQMPGLRSRRKSTVVLSVILYLLAAVFTVGMFGSVKNGRYPETAIGWIFVMGVPFCCFGNPFDLWNRLPFTQGATLRSQRVIYYSLGSLSCLFGLMVIGMINGPA